MAILSTFTPLSIALAAISISTAALAQPAPPSFQGDPEVYKVIYEDQNFRIIESTRGVGVRDKPHGHPLPSVVYNLTDCQSRQYAADGKTTDNAVKAGVVTPLPIIASHAAENTASTDCRQLFIERK
ncbi:hypothetical protein [Reyranella sp.]|uniref:hypothetical protein n=1 Tax=Reyranella sp. TaxID=1929291 RepID=UPI003D0D5687